MKARAMQISHITIMFKTPKPIEGNIAGTAKNVYPTQKKQKLMGYN